MKLIVKLIIILLLLTASCSNNKVVKNHGLRALDIKSESIPNPNASSLA